MGGLVFCGCRGCSRGECAESPRFRRCKRCLLYTSRHIDLPLSIDFMYLSSYGAGTQTTGSAKIIKDMDVDISGKDVLLVEDILDSGVTLSHVIDLLKQRHPASLKLCALLNKPDRRKIPVQLDYEGFEIPDEFVVGYGLDYDERYRNLPFVGILKREVYMQSDGTKEDK